MKVAILNDTHCGIRNSSDIFMDYQEKFYRDVFFPYLEERGIKKILHLGDYYENRTSINFRRIFLDVLRDRGIHMDIIPGNHDCYYKNTNKLNALKELLGHYMNEVRIIEKPMVVDYGGLPVGLIPWINPENKEEVEKWVGQVKCDIIGAHLELEGFEMQSGVLCPHGMDSSLFSRFDKVLSGHFHTKSTKGNVYYLGSQMEFFWSDCDDTKYFHVLDTETKQIETVENPHKIFHKLYYDGNDQFIPNLKDKFVKVFVINKPDPKAFDRFLDKISSMQIYGLQVAEDFSEFSSESVEDAKVSVEDTETLLYTYIDAIDTDLNKDTIKSKMRSLMVEAQTMEIA
jgi:DNA repair exonuclease SbcCD nuclease subunit